VSGAVERTGRVDLSRDLSEFLIELSIALHRHFMYPGGHPSLAPASEAVLARAERLFRDKDVISMGVARRQLVIGGVSTDPKHPVLRRLAEGLHRHRLGALSLHQGIDAAELSDVMLALAAEPERVGPLGTADEATLRRWPHVRLHPLSFEGLSLNEEALPPRHAELWIGLARAALAASDESTAGAADDPGDGLDPRHTPKAVARAIDSRSRQQAYDQVIVSYLSQIARELRSSTPDEAGELRRRTSELVSRLDPRTLQAFVAMSRQSDEPGAFVFDATYGVALDAVIDLAQSVAEANGETISHGLIRMLSKLAAHAELGPELSRDRADAELRDQVLELLSDWNLDDPNPDAYAGRLRDLSTGTTAAWAAGTIEGEVGDEPLRTVQLSLEVGAPGPLVDRAADQLLLEGRINGLLDMAMHPPDGAREVADRVIARCLDDRALRALLARDPLDVATLDRLLPLLPPEHYAVLLDALATSTNRVTRRRLLNRLVNAPIDISPLVGERLSDERWYVQRNMLVLLQRSGRLPEGFSPEAWAAHADARVRLEAIRLWLELPGGRDYAIHSAVVDGDARVVRAGLLALQHDPPVEWVPWLGGLAADPAADEEVRRLAVGALGASGQKAAQDVLLDLVDGGRTLLGRARIAAKSDVVLAALAALARAWPDDARVRPVLQAAAASPDGDVRAAVTEAP